MQEALIKRQLNQKGRKIVLRTRGSSHGPTTRLVSLSDLAQAMKPALGRKSVHRERMVPAICFKRTGLEFASPSKTVGNCSPDARAIARSAKFL